MDMTNPTLREDNYHRAMDWMGRMQSPFVSTYQTTELVLHPQQMSRHGRSSLRTAMKHGITKSSSGKLGGTATMLVRVIGNSNTYGIGSCGDTEYEGRVCITTTDKQQEFENRLEVYVKLLGGGAVGVHRVNHNLSPYCKWVIRPNWGTRAPATKIDRELLGQLLDEFTEQRRNTGLISYFTEKINTLQPFTINVITQRNQDVGQ